MNDAFSLQDQFDALCDPALWRELAPALHITDAGLAASSLTPIPFEQNQLERIGAAMEREGYFQTPPLDWGLDVANLAKAMTALVRAEQLPVFIFMYDEPWLMFARLRRLLALILDESYMMLPAFWAWHVDGKTEKAGWKVHRDIGLRALLPDRRAKAISVWIPLTEATTRNGCMQVLPADRDPNYGNRDGDLAVDLQNVRALPSGAGAVLGWTQALLHWGSRPADDADPPRISISVEFQRGDQLPIKEPLLDPETLPDFASRLRLILRQVLAFKHMYTLSPELQALAERFGPGAKGISS